MGSTLGAAKGWRSALALSAPAARARTQMTPHAVLAGAVEEAIEVLGDGHPRRQSLAGAGVQEVVEHLGGVEHVSAHRPVKRRGVPPRSDAEEADLALPPELLQRGHDLAQEILDGERASASIGLDHVVALQQIDGVAAQPLQAGLQRAADGAPDVAEILGQDAELGAHVG
jgi:hypothetical protein